MEAVNERLARLEEKVSRILDHGDATRAMLDGIAMKADENFIKIDERFNKIESKLNVLTNETSTNFTEVGDELGGIKAEIIKIGAATRYEQYHKDQKRFNIDN
ncbi:hypothetical protein [Pedobacter gandavensis]|uniref:hypothetical protein n=1 Tax=Pedobacter gandavensis TaxID=2679963 RepID=UPI00292FAB44|nr:hypothetical protein [Pedobacter gandavensis]